LRPDGVNRGLIRTFRGCEGFICGPVAIIRHPIVIIRDPHPIIRDSIVTIRDPHAIIRDPTLFFMHLSRALYIFRGIRAGAQYFWHAECFLPPPAARRLSGPAALGSRCRAYTASTGGAFSPQGKAVVMDGTLQVKLTMVVRLVDFLRAYPFGSGPADEVVARFTAKAERQQMLVALEQDGVAARWNPVLRDFYQRLRAAGKPAKLALTAVARKLLVLLNAMLRDGRRWQHA
jgi:hypothetical protein